MTMPRGLRPAAGVEVRIARLVLGETLRSPLPLMRSWNGIQRSRIAKRLSELECGIEREERVRTL